MLVAIGLPFMLEIFARQMLYPAPPVAVSSPPPAPLEEVWLDLSTGDRAQAWFYTPPNLPASAPIVVFFHGNGENLETVRWAGVFEELGGSALPCSLRTIPGMGAARGRPLKKG